MAYQFAVSVLTEEVALEVSEACMLGPDVDPPALVRLRAGS